LVVRLTSGMTDGRGERLGRSGREEAELAGSFVFLHFLLQA
jgi:hypothetical protein